MQSPNEQEGVVVVMQPLVLSFDETASSADLGGSSKYANENLYTEVAFIVSLDLSDYI